MAQNQLIFTEEKTPHVDPKINSIFKKSKKSCMYNLRSTASTQKIHYSKQLHRRGRGDKGKDRLNEGKNHRQENCWA